MKIEETSVFNFEGAIRGMRNPLNSWNLSDSVYTADGFRLGPKDLKLAKILANAGSDHGKFLRQIMVCVDITAPLTYWKEYDTYKVGTVANSTSTMHKIQSKPITLDDFMTEDMRLNDLEKIVEMCEKLRLEFLETKDKTVWRTLIGILPCAYEQTRTVTLNYQVLKNQYHSRKNHKLIEWHHYCDWIKTLPYAKELIIGEEDETN